MGLKLYKYLFLCIQLLSFEFSQPQLDLCEKLMIDQRTRSSSLFAFKIMIPAKSGHPGDSLDDTAGRWRIKGLDSKATFEDKSKSKLDGKNSLEKSTLIMAIHIEYVISKINSHIYLLKRAKCYFSVLFRAICQLAAESTLNTLIGIYTFAKFVQI